MAAEWLLLLQQLLVAESSEPEPTDSGPPTDSTPQLLELERAVCCDGLLLATSIGVGMDREVCCCC